MNSLLDLGSWDLRKKKIILSNICMHHILCNNTCNIFLKYNSWQDKMQVFSYE